MSKNIAGANKDSLLQRYLFDIEAYPTLSAEEETNLVKQIKLGDKTAVDKLVNANLRYVVWVARKYRSDGTALMELISEGNQGLIEAANKFDGSTGNRFITYATYWIQKYILEYLAQSHDAVYIPKYQAESLRRVRKASALFEQQHDRTPRPHELANQLGMKEEDVLFLLSLNQHSESFDKPINMGDQDESITFADVFQDDEADETDHKLTRDSLTTDIQRAFGLLNDREQQVLMYIYGIGTDKLTQQEIAQMLSISIPRVWQIKDRALHKLKVEGYDGDLKTYLEK